MASPAWTVEAGLAACLAEPATAARLAALPAVKRAYVTRISEYEYFARDMRSKASAFERFRETKAQLLADVNAFRAEKHALMLKAAEFYRAEAERCAAPFAFEDGEKAWNALREAPPAFDMSKDAARLAALHMPLSLKLTHDCSGYTGFRGYMQTFGAFALCGEQAFTSADAACFAHCVENRLKYVEEHKTNPHKRKGHPEW